MEKLAPIILFVYNRPEHTRRTLEALSKNDLAAESELFIYSDGPKANPSNHDLLKIKEVRKLIGSKPWCGKVNIVQQEFNIGLVKSEENGITDVLKEHSKIIVLEDDIITSPGFLKFMNKGLEIYKNDQEVFHISGYSWPVKLKIKYSTYFLDNSASPWGWATWRRAWKIYNPNSEELYNQIIQQGLESKFNAGKGVDFMALLKGNTWDLNWLASIFLHSGLALFPKKSLVENIGFDNSGVHCTDSNYFKKYSNKTIPFNLEISRINISVSRKAKRAIAKYSQKSRMRFLSKVWRRMKLNVRKVTTSN